MKRKRNTVLFLIILFLIIGIGFLIQRYYFGKSGISAIIEQDGETKILNLFSMMEMAEATPLRFKMDIFLSQKPTVLILYVYEPVPFPRPVRS